MIYKAYLLSKFDYKEFDEILKVLDEKGNIISILAKGVKKLKSKNRHALNVLNFNEFNTISKGNLQILKSASVITDNLDLTININLSASYLFIAELLSKTKKLSSIDIYELFDSMIKIKQKKYSDILKILFLYTREEGILTRTGKCGICNSSDNISYFSLRNGGMICSKCIPRKLKVKTLLTIYTYMRTNKFINDFDNIESVHLIREIINDIIEVTGFGILSANYFISQLPTIELNRKGK